MIPSRFQRLGREFFWVGLGHATAVMGAIVGMRLLTYRLPPAAYGELALGLTLVTLAHQLVLSPISNASLRFFSPAQEANQLQVYLQGLKVLLVRGTALLLAVVGMLSLGLWAAGQEAWLGLSGLAFLFALLSGYSSVLDGMQNAARQRVIVAWHDGLAPWLRFMTAVALIHVLGAFSAVAMLGYALASAVLLGSQLWFFHGRIFVLSAAQGEQTSGDIQTWTKQMYVYAWPFTTWGLFSWAQMASDRWALQTFSTTGSVGLYAVLYQLGYYPITILSGLMSQLVSPVLFSRAGDGSDLVRLNSSRRLNDLVVLGMVVLTALAMLLAFLLHSHVFALLVAPKYREVSARLPWMVLSGGLFASGQVAVLSLLSGTDTQKLITPKIITGLLGTSLNFFGAYRFGMDGVVLASTISSLIYLGWILYLTQLSRRSLFQT